MAIIVGTWTGHLQQKLPAWPGICPFFSNAQGLPRGVPGGDARGCKLTHTLKVSQN